MSLDPKTQDIRLGIVQRLVTAFDLAGIDYCHWKSNKNLDAAVTGKTDLDILFNPQQQADAIGVLRRQGFRRFVAVWYRRYPGIGDFIGIDPETGVLVHVHAHFCLVLGEAGLKSYHWNIEEYLLARREWDDRCQTYRSDRTSEFILLAVREALRRQLWQSGNTRAATESEFQWLVPRVSAEKLHAEASVLLGETPAGLICQLHAEGLSNKCLNELRRALRRRLQDGRRYSTARAVTELWLRKVARVAAKYARRFGMRGLMQRRAALNGGAIIAFVGADGVGKSTVSLAVTKHLSRKIDAEWIYFGSGNGPRSLTRRMTELLLFRKLGDPFSALWAISLAIEKRNKLRNVAKWRRNGKIILCDRYPQVDVNGYNDGPLLARLSTSRFRFIRAIADWERRCYGQANIFAPDVAFRLFVNIDELARRRPKTKMEIARMKQDGIWKVRFPSTTRVVDLNCDRPIEDVIREVLGTIGVVLSASDRVGPRSLAQNQ